MSGRWAAVVFALALAAGSLTACGATAARSSARPPAVTHPDPPTKQALLRIARAFNADYADNADGAVYDRWDARSRAIIPRAEYIRRHRECPTNPGPAVVQGATRAGRWWLVRYEISGAELTDDWRYERRRWQFDLLRSNPQAARLYRLPAARYFAAVGCAGDR